MKYAEFIYLTEDWFGADEYVSNQTFKIVTTRTEHFCPLCNATFPSKTVMIKEKAIVEGEGWKSSYICIPCADKWLDECNEQ